MLEDCISQIKDRDLKQMAEYFITKYEPVIAKMPASLSGYYHKAEKNCEDHIRRTFWFASQIAIEMNLNKLDTSILQTAALLHDMSNYELTYPQDHPAESTILYPSGWYRSSDAYTYHGVIGGFLIGEYMLHYRTEKVMEKIVLVALAVSCHMGHWHPTCPQPTSDIQKYLALADFLASRDEIQLTTEKS
jgi:hypothetical protein